MPKRSDEGVLNLSLRDTYGPKNELDKRLLGKDGHIWLEAFKRFLRKENPWEDLPPTNTENVWGPLTFVGQTEVGPIEAFQACDLFIEGRRPEGIEFVPGKNFKENFVDGGGKIEIDVPFTNLTSYQLVEKALDSSIIATLGGSYEVNTHLACVAALMLRQPKGEAGPLLTNGWPNIFYVPDRFDKLMTVRCFYESDKGRWDVGCYSSPADLIRWQIGTRVFTPVTLSA